jgi:hypothetical protein
MKNALLAVLFIAVCYDNTQAQVIPQRPAGYIKYQGTHPTQPVGKGSSTNNTITDGAVTADKLASDIFISNITADGTVSTDKLADDILNAMRSGNRRVNGNASTQHMLPAMVPLYSAGSNKQQSYARYMQQVMWQWQYAQNFSSKSKRTGWLQYKVD